MTWQDALDEAAARTMAPPVDAPRAEQMRRAATTAHSVAGGIREAVDYIRSVPDDIDAARQLQEPELAARLESHQQTAAESLIRYHLECFLIHQRLARHRPDLARMVPQLQLPIALARADDVVNGLLLIHREANIPEDAC